MAIHEWAVCLVFLAMVGFAVVLRDWRMLTVMVLGMAAAIVIRLAAGWFSATTWAEVWAVTVVNAVYWIADDRGRD